MVWTIDPVSVDDGRRAIGAPATEIVSLNASSDGRRLSVGYINRDVALWSVPDFSLVAYLTGSKTRGWVIESPFGDQPLAQGFGAAYAMGWRDTTYLLTSTKFSNDQQRVILCFDAADTWNGRAEPLRGPRIEWNPVTNRVEKVDYRAGEISENASIEHGIVGDLRCDFSQQSEIVLRRVDSDLPVAWFHVAKCKMAQPVGTNHLWALASADSLWILKLQSDG
jgi:hypothetical protein